MDAEDQGSKAVMENHSLDIQLDELTEQQEANEQNGKQKEDIKGQVK